MDPRKPPVPGDAVRLRENGTIWLVVNTMAVGDGELILVLGHPLFGKVVVGSRALDYPVSPSGENLSLPSEGSGRAICVKCRWHTVADAETPQGPYEKHGCIHPEYGRQHGSLDYVTGERVPLDCYTLNGCGQCRLFEVPLGDQIQPDELEENS